MVSSGDSSVTVQAAPELHAYCETVDQPGNGGAWRDGYGEDHGGQLRPSGQPYGDMVPAGFTWEASTHPSVQVDRSGQEVIFTLFDEESLTYTVTASSTEGSHPFSGTLTRY